MPYTGLKDKPVEKTTPGKVISPTAYKGLTGVKVVEKPSTLGKIAQFGKDIAKDATQTLLINPATRVAEVVGKTGVFGEDVKRGYETMASEGAGQDLDLGVLGEYNVPTVKPFGEGGGQQIAGEALKSASYLAPFTKPVSAFLKTAPLAQVAGYSGLEGASFGAGDAMARGESGEEILKQGAIGFGIGLVAPLAFAGAKKLLKGKTSANIPTKTIKEVGEEVEKTGVTTKAPKSTKTIEEVLTPDSVPAQAIPEQPVIKTQVVNPKQTVEVLDDVVRNTENIVDDEFVRQKSTEYFTKLQKYTPEEILSTLRKGESLEGMPKEALSSFLAKHADDTGDLGLAKKVRRQMFAEKGGQEAQARTLSKGTTADITRDIIKGRAKTQGIDLVKAEGQTQKLTKDLTRRVKQVIESSKQNVKVTKEQVKEIIKDLIC